MIGWSFGGLVAQAIATHLQAQGESVALLALLDSYPVELNGQSQSPDLDDETILANQLKALGYYQGDAPLQVASALDLLRKGGDILSNLEAHQITAIIQVLKQNVRLASNFVPQRFDGDILLFAATQDDTPRPDSWKPYITGKVVVREVDCEHAHMMRSSPLTKIGLALARELDKTAPKSRRNVAMSADPAAELGTKA